MTESISINAHSSIRIGTEKILYFDPYLISEESHDADIVFFTHNHFDHFSPEDFAKVAKDGTVFVCPSSMTKDLLSQGINPNRIVQMSPFETKEVQGITVESYPAYNVSKEYHPRENGWLGYLAVINGKRVYVCGDTDKIPEAASINCDVILVPIGGKYTMNASEAAFFVNAISPETAIPTHYGSVIGTKEDLEEFTASVNPSIKVKVLIR